MLELLSNTRMSSRENSGKIIDSAAAEPIVKRTIEMLGLSESFELNRIGANAVYKIGEDFIRIDLIGLPVDRIQQQLDFASFLFNQGIPTSQVLSTEPLLIDGYLHHPLARNPEAGGGSRNRHV